MCVSVTSAIDTVTRRFNAKRRSRTPRNHRKLVGFASLWYSVG
jgi:hypothetical protein